MAGEDGGREVFEETRIAMTGWTVWARFVGSADEESKVSTSKVEGRRSKVEGRKALDTLLPRDP
jgi:hypothetical protein